MSRAVYDVIVVGCGAAGVAALCRLAAADGVRALGLEASARRGGRVRTIDMGGAVELGAEWIHGEAGNPVYSYATRNSVPITKDIISFDFRRSDGAAPDRDLCDELFTYCWDCRDLALPSDETVGDYVTRSFTKYTAERNIPATLRDQMLHFADLLCCNYDATDTWRQMSLSASQYYEELPGHLHWSFGQAGYQKLFDLMQAGKKLDIRLNSEVISIDYDSQPVKIECRNGESYYSKHVIVTVSLGVLKERHKTLFKPHLPDAKIQIINELNMGVMDKICLRYSTQWWPTERKFVGFLWRDEELKSAEGWMTRVLGFSTPTGSSEVITIWTSGEMAKIVEEMPEEKVLDGCKRMLQMFMGKDITVPDAIAIERSLWYSNPFTRGSYSFRSRPVDTAPLRAAILRDGIPILQFAGEACSERHYSTVHGAISTGLQAADNIDTYVKSHL